MPSIVSVPKILARLIALSAMLAVPLGAAAAQGVIRGRVTDASNQRPIADAQVAITGTTSGAVTNQNGDYVIANVPSGQRQVVVRKIGFARQTRTVNVGADAGARADFALSQSATQLEQVVVTGTGGSAERKTLGNSITVLDVAGLTEKTSILNVTEVLQSKTPGVTILPGSGAAGTAGEIRIRGASSLSGYRPVVFIDGIRYNIDDLGGFSATGGGTAGLAQSTQVTSALNSLDPNDIESIEVIKGPAAATLYGAEAANGVIQIITKKGSRGQQEMRWSVKAERGTNEYTLLPGDNYTTCDATKKAARVSASDTTLVWPGCQTVALNAVISGNPMRDDSRALRVGDLSRLGLSLRGGGDKYSYYVSGDRDTEQGVFYNSDNNRTSIRSNFGFSPNDKSNIAINMNWQSGRIRLPIQDESANGLLLSARRGFPGRISLLGAGNEGWRTISPTAANKYQNYTSTDRYTLGGTFSYNPVTWWQNRLTAGFDNSVVQAQLLFLPGVIDVSQDADAASGANLRRTPTRRVVTLDYAGTMNWNMRSSLLSTTTFGSQVVADKSTSLSATGIGIGAPDVTLVNLLQRSTGAEGFSENNSVGYYVQEQLGWNDRLFLTGAVRADDHSSFGTNFDLIVYPKVSLSYVISDEPAAKNFLNSAQISSLKLRTAWGQAGRAPSAYSAPQTYTVDRVTLGTTTASAIRTAAFGNPDLKPEKGEELELGFDMGLFTDRMNVDFTYYNKTTKDMLQSISVPASTGFISSQLTNLGEVNNRGIEVALTGTPIQRNNFSWQTQLNYSTNRNELVTFGVKDKILDTPSGQAYGSVQQHRAGYPLGGYWVARVLRAADGSAILTTAGAATFDTARVYLGPSTPTREIGFSNTITLFRNLRLYALLDHKGGHYIFNLQERNRCQASDNCTRNNDPRARFPQTAADTILFKEIAVYKNSSVSPEWIQKADFTKLRELSLTYDLPETLMRRFGGRGASITVSGRNLKLWSDYEGADPEVNTYGGRNFVRVDAYAAPVPRRLSATFTVQY
ncbi:MAG: SusC/RagA family TonB-linked outer membrane protein [Gemmatimonadaceae bacterium]|nr:SusC/RagA family TonB-linked outer membrane protein [Gemmatimonadaceae bacterium]